MDKKISIKKLNPVWRSMKTRCYSTKCKQYSNYGGRGISVCREWVESFDSFYKWAINNGWEEGLAIDRINNNGNYEPSNCRFVLPKENNAIGRRNYLNKNNSGYVGVTYHSQTCKWASRIGFEGRKINIGIYETIEDAVQARILKEIELFGEQKTNFHYHNKINSIEDTFIELKFYAMKQLNKEINEAELCGNESLKKELYAKTRCLENNFNLIFGKCYTENNDIDYQARVGRAALKIVGMYIFDDIEEMLRIAESEGE